MQRDGPGREAGLVAIGAGEEVVGLHPLGQVALDRQLVAGHAGLGVHGCGCVVEAALVGRDAAPEAEAVQVAHHPVAGIDAEQLDRVRAIDQGVVEPAEGGIGERAGPTARGPGSLMQRRHLAQERVRLRSRARPGDTQRPDLAVASRRAAQLMARVGAELVDRPAAGAPDRREVDIGCEAGLPAGAGCIQGVGQPELRVADPAQHQRAAAPAAAQRRQQAAVQRIVRPRCDQDAVMLDEQSIPGRPTALGEPQAVAARPGAAASVEQRQCHELALAPRLHQHRIVEALRGEAPDPRPALKERAPDASLELPPSLLHEIE